MRLPQIGTISTLLLLLAIGFQNCGRAPAAAAPSANAGASKSSQLISLIDSLSGADLSCDQDNDCVVVAIGHRACGGASGYVITSRENPNLEQVQALAQQSTIEDTQAAGASGSVSTCEYHVPPVASCVQRTCQSSSDGATQ